MDEGIEKLSEEIARKVSELEKELAETSWEAGRMRADLIVNFIRGTLKGQDAHYIVGQLIKMSIPKEKQGESVIALIEESEKYFNNKQEVK